MLLLLLAILFQNPSAQAGPSLEKNTVYYGIATEATLPFVEISHAADKPEIVKGILRFCGGSF